MAGRCLLGLAARCEDVPCAVGCSRATTLRKTFCLFAWWRLCKPSEAGGDTEGTLQRWPIFGKCLCWTWVCGPPWGWCYRVPNHAWTSQDAHCYERRPLGRGQCFGPMGGCFNEQCYSQSPVASLAIWWWHCGIGVWRTGHSATSQLAARHWVAELASEQCEHGCSVFSEKCSQHFSIL